MNRLFLVVLLFVQGSVFASTVDNTKIKSILAGQTYGNVVFLQIDPKPSTIDATCQQNSQYNFAFDPTTEIGKVTLSMVLTAYASQNDVYLDGDKLCGTNSAGVEDVRQIWIK